MLERPWCKIFAHGRWASCLLPSSFGRYQNLLRMILIDIASLVTAPKEARPQALFRFSSTKAEIAISVDLLLHTGFDTALSGLIW
jgi:hypothetical protein